tara:strand:+ start:14527 stop:15552 length:1026 start_codon:yes stop_codon:yes gene_type:complete
MNNLKNNKIKALLVVGLGSIGLRHIKIAKSLREEIEIIALTSRPLDFKDNPLIKYSVDNLDEALKLSPDAAIISNPAPYHLEFATPLALNSVPMLIEKPISDSLAKVVEFRHAVNSTDNFVLVGYNLRFLNSLKLFRDLIHGKEVGKILSVRAEVGQDLRTWRKDRDYREAVSSKSSLGGGVLLELSHEIDYLAWIFGKIHSVAGFFDRVSDLEIDVEDISHLLIKFNDSFNSENLVANLSLDFLRKDTTRCCTAIGEAGTLSWDGINCTVKIFKEGEWHDLFEEGERVDCSYENQLLHFFDCIENSRVPIADLDSSVDVLRLIEGIKLSSSKNNFVEIVK